MDRLQSPITAMKLFDWQFRADSRGQDRRGQPRGRENRKIALAGFRLTSYSAPSTLHTLYSRVCHRSGPSFDGLHVLWRKEKPGSRILVCHLSILRRPCGMRKAVSHSNLLHPYRTFSTHAHAKRHVKSMRINLAHLEPGCDHLFCGETTLETGQF